MTHIIIMQTNKRPRLRGTTAAFLAIALWPSALFVGAPSACAQDEEEGGTAKIARLTREFNDPLMTLPQSFLQDAYTPENYGTEAPTNRLIGRVIIPRIPEYSLLPFVQLIRPSFSLVTVPTGKGSGDTRTEFGDMQLFDFAVLPWPRSVRSSFVGFRFLLSDPAGHS